MLIKLLQHSGCYIERVMLQQFCVNVEVFNYQLITIIIILEARAEGGKRKLEKYFSTPSGFSNKSI